MIWDVVVVGAGAAGLMTAIQVSGEGRRVLLLDGQAQIGAKILMSGGTRCNVTNVRVTEKDYHSEKPRVVRNVLAAYTNIKAKNFFESIGVQLIPEEGGKYFPSTNSAKTVLDALIREVEKCGVTLLTGKRVESIEGEFETFKIIGKTFQYEAKTVVVCTGGLSYPGTGSDGQGYEVAKKIGHSIIPTIPALSPLLLKDADWKSLSGVALPCRLTLKVESKIKAEFQDAILFTHFGLSGPAALDMSRHWLRYQKSNAVLLANFLPKENEETLRKFFDEVKGKYPDRSLKRCLTEKLSERIVEVLLNRSQISKDLKAQHLSRESREKLIAKILRTELHVTGVFGYSKAEATAGGVNLDEVDSRVLESQKRAGLFFAGEVLDVDGRIGGFNFQWAWSSGFAAAQGVIRRLQAKI